MNQATGAIVVGYDGSDQAGVAVEWAAAEAERRGRPLTVVHVADYGMIPGPVGTPPWRPDLVEQAGLRIAAHGAELARKVAPSVEVSSDVDISGVTFALVERSRKAELVVLGTQAHGNLGALALGSIAYGVAAHAHGPVAIVRGDSSAPAGPQRPVLVGVDGSEPGAAALHYAADLAAASAATLIVMSTYSAAADSTWTESVVHELESDGGPTLDTLLHERAQSVVTDAVGQALQAHPELDVQERVTEGPAAKELCRAATGCGAVVVGSRGRGAFVGLLLGSVGHGVVHQAPCPVVVVR